MKVFDKQEHYGELLRSLDEYFPEATQNQGTPADLEGIFDGLSKEDLAILDGRRIDPETGMSEEDSVLAALPLEERCDHISAEGQACLKTAIEEVLGE